MTGSKDTASGYLSKLRTFEELVELLDPVGRQQRLVLCHGCFDLVHPGHIRHLEWARSQGDVLLVSISADHQVRKGAGRPYLPHELRAENLAALEMVDFVTVTHADGAGELIEALKPDVYAKGLEAEAHTEGLFGEHRRRISQLGGEMAFGPPAPIFSSSHIVDRELTHSDRVSMLPELCRAFRERHALDDERLRALLGGIATRRVVVVGDISCALHTHGEVLGQVPDHPGASFREQEQEFEVGCSAAVARYLSGLGAQVTLVSWTGDDELGERARGALVGLRAEFVRVVDRPTPMKQRWVSQQEVLFERTNIDCAPLPTAARAEVVQRLESIIAEEQVDVLVACDFGFGLFGDELHAAITAAAQAGLPVAADVQCVTCSPDIRRHRGATLLTPNEGELARAFAELDFEAAAEELAEESSATRVVVTRGAQGMWLLDLGAADVALRTTSLPAFNPAPLDTSGCGDAVLAMMAGLLASDASLAESAWLASAAAAVVSERMGNDVPSTDDIEVWLDSVWSN